LQHSLNSTIVVIYTKLQMNSLINILFRYEFKQQQKMLWSTNQQGLLKMKKSCQFQVCQEEEFLQLSSCQLVALIRRDHLNVREERDVYNAVLKVKNLMNAHAFAYFTM
jgi:hypothetical protein